MSWAAVVIAGGAVAGAAISGSAARGAADTASGDAQAQLAFAREQQADWKAVYGPAQDNLAAYYSNITPEYYETVGLEAIEGEFETVRSDLDRTLAQRGVTDSGVALSLEKDIAIQEAEAKADVRRSAPSLAAEEQSRFLQIGMGSDPSSSVSQALSQRSATSQRIAEQSAAAAGRATGAAVGTITTGLSDYLTKRAETS